MKRPSHSQQCSETGGQILADDLLMDLVRDARGKVDLAVWNGSSTSITSRFDWNGRTFIPPTETDEVVKAVRFPTRVGDSASTGELFADLCRFFSQHRALPEESVRLLAYFAMSSWFPECAAIWPCISITTWDASASSSLLRQLSCVLRHPLHLGDVTVGGLLSLPSWLSPTLIIDQPVPTLELQRSLRMISRPGGLIARKGRLFNVSCPAIVCTAEPLTDPWLIQSSIPVVVVPAAPRLSATDRELAKFSEDMQAKLLAYRLGNFSKVHTSRFDAPELSSPVREVACTLGSCVVGDPELQAGVIPLLQEHDEEIRVHRSLTTRAIVTEAGLFLSHENKRESAYVGEIATISNGILKGRGETLELESRAVGHILRTMGLPTKRLGEAGRGIFFLNDVRRRIHRLAWSYGVRSVQNGGVEGCQYCAEAKFESIGD
jgi:hypothetical protein